MILLFSVASKKIIKNWNEIDHSPVGGKVRYRARQFLTFERIIRKQEQQAKNIGSAFSNCVPCYRIYWHYP